MVIHPYEKCCSGIFQECCPKLSNGGKWLALENINFLVHVPLSKRTFSYNSQVYMRKTNIMLIFGCQLSLLYNTGIHEAKAWSIKLSIIQISKRCPVKPVCGITLWWVMAYPNRTCSSISIEAGFLSTDLPEVSASSSSSEDVTVTANANENGEIKLTIDVSGSKTQGIFDNVFSKLVASAQPLPGFQRVKGDLLGHKSVSLTHFFQIQC